MRISLNELFYFRCDQQWDELQPTADQNIRFCTKCEHTVHYCDTITEARTQAENRHCIAVDLGVIRRPGDLEPEMMFLGMPSPETLRREKERTKPDPVSEERAKRKARITQLASAEATEESRSTDGL